MRKFESKLNDLLMYQKAIKGFNSYLCILDELLKRELVRIITIDGTNIYVRSNTPDLKVAISSLFEKVKR